MPYTRWCDQCRTQTESTWNVFFDEYCFDCGRERAPRKFEALAYICMSCERGFDEEYAGQRVCNECHRLMNDE